MMNLKILLPTEILIDCTVSQVVAPGEDGQFCLLPKHIDFVSALAPGILCFTSEQGEVHYVGLGRATLVKWGSAVKVSSVYGIVGADLGMLRKQLAARFETQTDRERHARSAIARLEADLLRRFVDLGGVHGSP